MNVGDIKKISGCKGEYQVIEIIDAEGLDMTWEWKKVTCNDCGAPVLKCSNCDSVLGGKKTHLLEKAILLIPKDLEFNGHEDKLVILGYTKEKKPKIMKIPPEQVFKILARSNAFFKRKNIKEVDNNVN